MAGFVGSGSVEQSNTDTVCRSASSASLVRHTSQTAAGDPEGRSLPFAHRSITELVTANRSERRLKLQKFER
jgi:hypothetical protein